VIRCDALIVGGGPAGSTCARELRRAGWDVIVADRAKFPRDKVCAGWLTPRVFELLELDPEEYRSTGLTLQDIRGFRTGLMGSDPLETKYSRVVSYAIRRCEFDDYLLRRSGARVLESTSIHTLRYEGARASQTTKSHRRSSLVPEGISVRLRGISAAARTRRSPLLRRKRSFG
jgi:flavin-dependent dehydrogenase